MDASAGYSLVELLIVVALAMVLLTAAVPGITRLQQEWILWGAARALEASIQWGRMHAVASNAPVIFYADDVLQEFYWADAASGEPLRPHSAASPARSPLRGSTQAPIAFLPAWKCRTRRNVHSGRRDRILFRGSSPGWKNPHTKELNS